MNSWVGKTKEHRWYHIGSAVFFLCILLIILQRIGIFIPTKTLPPCFFHKITGFSCPGCGCTRAIEALANGKLIASLCYNPFILYCTVVYLTFMLTHTLELILTKIRKGKSSHLLKKGFSSHIKGIKARDQYIYAAIILILGNWVGRLIYEISLRILAYNIL